MKANTNIIMILCQSFEVNCQDILIFFYYYLLILSNSFIALTFLIFSCGSRLKESFLFILHYHKQLWIYSDLQYYYNVLFVQPDMRKVKAINEFDKMSK
jgi:hypothetical protein